MATEEGCCVREEFCAATDCFLTRLQTAEIVPSAEGRVSAAVGRETWCSLQRDFVFCS